MPPTRSNHHVERNVTERRYQDPGRARAAIARAHISPKQRKRLLGLVDEWQNEEQPPLVAGEPPEPTNGAAAEVNEAAAESETSETSAPETVDSSGREPLILNPYARVRAQLTLEGLALLHQCKEHLSVPDDLVAKGGVWETSLWELSHLLANQRPKAEFFVGGTFAVLDPQPPKPKATIGLAHAIFGGLGAMSAMFGQASEARKNRALKERTEPPAEPAPTSPA